MMAMKTGTDSATATTGTRLRGRENTAESEQGSREEPARGHGVGASTPAPVGARDDAWLYQSRRGRTLAGMIGREQPGGRPAGADEARTPVEPVAKKISRNLDSQIREDSRIRGRIPASDSKHPENEEFGRLPRLVPLFPLGAFTPQSTCPHHGPIRRGSVFCCMVCSQSGMDGHPALQRDPLTDPRPEPNGKTPSAPKPRSRSRETRRERRRKQFAR